MKKYLPYIAVFLVGLLIGWLPKGRLQQETIVEKRDTIVVTDTITMYEPKEVVKERWKTEMLVVTDTIRMSDTLYMPLPLEKKEYREKEYYAVVTGYAPSLDYIEVYPKTMYVTEQIRKKDKRNSLSLGVEAGYIGTPCIPIYLEYERKLHKNFSIYARGEYDLLEKIPGGRFGARAFIEW